MAFQAGTFLAQLAMGQAFGMAMHPVNNYWASLYKTQDYANHINAWYAEPIMYPEPAGILAAYSKGIITDENDAIWALKANGINWSAAIPRIPERRQGESNLDYDRRVKNSRKMLGWEAVRRAALARPGVSDAMSLWTRGHLMDNELYTMLNKAGADVNSWYGLRESFFQPLDLGIVMSARNREYINDEQVSIMLKRLGYRIPIHRAILDRMRESLPTISDLVMFGVRDVWDRLIVDSNGLFDEFPEAMREHARKLGLYGNSGIKFNKGNVETEATWPEVYWASHWLPMPIFQGHEAFHRMRPNRLDRFRAAGVPVEAFTLDNLKTLIKQADYPPKVRDWMAAVAFNPLGRREIRAAVGAKARLDVDPSYSRILGNELTETVKAYDKQWAIEQYKDLGLIPADAEASADIALVAGKEKANSFSLSYDRSVKGKTANAAINAFKTGAIEEIECWELLEATGITHNSAVDTTEAIKINRTASIVQAAVNGIRSDYFAGVLSTDEMTVALERAGVEVNLRTYYVEKWSIQLNRRRKTATTQQLLAWLEQGLIQQAEAIQRLTNLGWSSPDILTLLRVATIAVAKVQAKTILAEQRSSRQAAKELELAAKQSAALRNRTLADLRKVLPKASILAWLRKGLVTWQYATSRLKAQEYPSESITNWIREAMLHAPVKETVTVKDVETIPPAGEPAKPPVETITHETITQNKP